MVKGGGVIKLASHTCGEHVRVATGGGLRPDWLDATVRGTEGWTKAARQEIAKHCWTTPSEERLVVLFEQRTLHVRTWGRSVHKCFRIRASAY